MHNLSTKLSKGSPTAYLKREARGNFIKLLAYRTKFAKRFLVESIDYTVIIEFGNRFHWFHPYLLV